MIFFDEFFSIFQVADDPELTGGIRERLMNELAGQIDSETRRLYLWKDQHAGVSQALDGW